MNRKPHLTFVHKQCREFAKTNMHFIDATCGNGHDTAFLNELAESTGSRVSSLDIQMQALKNAKANYSFNKSRVALYHKSHEDLSALSPFDIVLYNLGYLPSSDKSCTTTLTTTVASLHSAIRYSSKKALILFVCYTGHKEGKEESLGLLQEIKTLDHNLIASEIYRWSDDNAAPFVISIRKGFPVKQ